MSKKIEKEMETKIKRNGWLIFYHILLVVFAFAGETNFCIATGAIYICETLLFVLNKFETA